MPTVQELIAILIVHQIAHLRGQQLLLIGVSGLLSVASTISGDTSIDRLRGMLLLVGRMVLGDGRRCGRVIVRVVIIGRRTGRRETGMVVDGRRVGGLNQ